jgi:hypothetical protein
MTIPLQCKEVSTKRQKLLKKKDLSRKALFAVGGMRSAVRKSPEAQIK